MILSYGYVRVVALLRTLSPQDNAFSGPQYIGAEMATGYLEPHRTVCYSCAECVVQYAILVQSALKSKRQQLLEFGQQGVCSAVVTGCIMVCGCYDMRLLLAEYIAPLGFW